MKTLRFYSLSQFAALIVLYSTLVSTSSAAEQWDCSLDLKQGDTGSLSLIRDNEMVSGKISITRSSTSIEQEVDGRWSGRELELTRYTNASANQKMHGITVKLGTQQLKIGGRYAENMSGVWSADCNLLSNASSSINLPSQASAQILPSTSTQVKPYRPSNTDQIKFAAQATHPDGIESVAFYLGSKQVHSCADASCSFTYGRLKPGKYQWHVIATSSSGVKSLKRSNQLVVSGKESAGVCTITGLATGPAVAQSAAVMLELSGQNGRQAARFDAGVYSFTKLQPGSYTLNVNTSENSGLLVSPATQEISCDGGQIVQQNFEFR